MDMIKNMDKKKLSIIIGGVLVGILLIILGIVTNTGSNKKDFSNTITGNPGSLGDAQYTCSEWSGGSWSSWKAGSPSGGDSSCSLPTSCTTQISYTCVEVVTSSECITIGGLSSVPCYREKVYTRTRTASQCDDGYYLVSGNCYKCEAGYSCDGKYKSACTGSTYQDQEGQSSCKTCSGAVNSDHTECLITSCSEGTFINEDGDCETCPAGYSCNGTTKTACSFSNEYQDQTGQSSCKQAPSNSTVNSTHTSYTCNSGYVESNGACILDTSSSYSISCPSSIYVGETGTCNISGGSLTGSVTSSSSSVASVSSTGSSSFSIKGVSAGSATFTATINGQSVTSNSVTVKSSTVSVTSVSVSCNSSSLTVGSNTSCTATVLPSDATSKSVTWSSSDSSIAGVDQSGYVTAKSAGTVVIRATSTSNSSKYDTYSITVASSDSPTLIDYIGVSPASADLKVGDSQTLSVYSYYEDTSELISNSQVAWVSNDTSVATVSGGKITAKSSGTATITASYNGYIAYCHVTVTEDTDFIVSIPAIRSVQVGNSTTLSPTFTGISSSEVTYTFSSSDTSVATVTNGGVVTGKKVGSATITVTATRTSDGAKRTDTCDLTVTAATAVDSINGESVIAIAADVGTVTGIYGATDSNGVNVKVVWSATGAGASYTDCDNTTSCNISFSHQGSGSSVTTTPATVTATAGGVTKTFDVTVYSYCAWTLVDTNKGPYTDVQFLSMANTRDAMKYMTGCHAYEGFHKESDGWYYVNHYNRCCGTGGGEQPATYACYVNASTGDYKWATTSPGSGYVISTTITTEGACVAPVIDPQYCYIKKGNGTPNSYCFGTSSECSGYTEKVSGVDKASECSETPACYQTSSGAYVTGSYSGQTGYTYVGATCPVTPVEDQYCYVKIGNGTPNSYCFGTSKECSGYTQKVNNVSSAYYCFETPACYQTSSGAYVTGNYSGQTGYAYIGASCPSTPVEPQYCYVKLGNGSPNTYCFGVASKCLGYPQKVDGVNNATACSETPGCYKTSSGSYVTGTYSGQNGYTYVGTSCPSNPTSACYKDSTGTNFTWSTTSPGSNWTVVSGKTEETCKACFVNKTTNDYKWSTSSPGSGYVISTTITTENKCIAPPPTAEEKPACYKDNKGNYVWGTYAKDDSYTLIKDIDNKDDCKNVVDVPITAADVNIIIYISVFVMAICGGTFIYFVYFKKKNN